MSFPKFTLAVLSVLIISFSACKTRTPIVNIPAHWSSMNPSGIPLQIREKEQDKGNLLINSSFESGRYYRVDTLSSSFNLTGWKKVGDNVFWTDIMNEKEYNNNEASNGSHAIKVIRKKSNETDTQGEGIISEYIRVIPGNYELSMDLRLKNIETNLERLIDHVFDAVNIRLFFYDRNKVIIKSHLYHPVYDNIIDNCFKAVPLSNFSFIEDFGWARLIARAGNFPFTDGYIPDEARYIKIFVGLKGTGTLWVDRLDFRYSNKNFTFLEKTEALMDSTIAPSRLILPEPHRAVSHKTIPLIAPDDQRDGLKPLILLPLHADTREKEIISMLIEKLRDKGLYNRLESPVIYRITSNDIQSGRLIFNFGNTMLSDQYADQINREEELMMEQSCCLQRIDALDNVIFIDYSDLQGLFRSLNIIIQLCDVENNFYNHYDIIDFPDFKRRAVLWPVGKDKPDLLKSGIDFLTLTGLNSFLIEPQGEELDHEDFISESKFIYPHLIDLQKGLPFLKLGYSFNGLSYSELKKVNGLKWESDSALIIKSAVNQGELLLRLLDKLKSEQPDFLMFSDKLLWSALNNGPLANTMKFGRKEEFKKYLSLREAFWKPLFKNIGSVNRVNYLLPLISDNRVKNTLHESVSAYYDLLEKESDIFDKFLWSGPVYSSFYLDDADYQSYKSNNPVDVILFDNTLTLRAEESVPSSYHSLFPGIMTTGSLFEPYHVSITNNVREGVNYECFLNIGSVNDLSLVRLGTAADYLWNGVDYDPFFSAWKVLLNLYGKPLAKELVYFNDVYYHIISLCMELEGSGYNQKSIRTGEEMLRKLNSHWQVIENLSTGKSDFLNQVSDFKNSAINRFNKSKRQNVMSVSDDKLSTPG